MFGTIIGGIGDSLKQFTFHRFFWQKHLHERVFLAVAHDGFHAFDQVVPASKHYILAMRHKQSTGVSKQATHLFVFNVLIPKAATEIDQIVSLTFNCMISQVPASRIVSM